MINRIHQILIDVQDGTLHIQVIRWYSHLKLDYLRRSYCRPSLYSLRRCRRIQDRMIISRLNNKKVGERGC